LADITDTEAVQFTQLLARPTANAIAYAYWLSKKTLAEWFGNDLGSVVTNDTSLVTDGCPKPVTGAQVTSVITRASELVTDLEASGGAKLNTILAATTLSGE
jgi:hypothetical protein